MRSTTPERIRINLEANEAGEFVFTPTGPVTTVWVSKDEAGGVFIEHGPDQSHLTELLGLKPGQWQEIANPQALSPASSSGPATAGPAPFPFDRCEPTAETQSLVSRLLARIGSLLSSIRRGRAS